MFELSTKMYKVVFVQQFKSKSVLTELITYKILWQIYVNRKNNDVGKVKQKSNSNSNHSKVLEWLSCYKTHLLGD